MSERGDNPQVSILLVCHNDGKWLPRCLESIRAQTISDRLEVIIADNASQDGSDRLAQSLISGWNNARFLSTGGDNGFCIGTNRAAAAATGKYLFVINPDTWLERDCVEQLYQALEREQAGVAGPTMLPYETDTPPCPCPSGFDFCGNLLLPSDAINHSDPFSAGGFFCIRRDLFARLGGLDEQFFMYGEEQDLAWRTWTAGERIIAVPASRIHHQGAVGVNPDGTASHVEVRTSVQKRFLSNRNRLLVLLKNCQHLLLLMFIPCAALVVIEGCVTLAMTRRWSVAKGGSLAAFGSLWRLRRYIWEQRCRVAKRRRRSDFWMLRFFGFGFGRRQEFANVLRAGFPKLK